MSVTLSPTQPVSDSERRAMLALKQQALQMLTAKSKGTFADALDSASSSDEAQAVQPTEDELVLLEVGSKDSPRHISVAMGDLDATKRHELGKLMQASEQFEGVLVKQLFAQMQKSVPKSSMSGPMGDMAQDIFNEAVSQDLAKKGSMSISSMLYKQLSQRILQQTAGEKVQTRPTMEVES
jgi:hypothetical protein